MAQLRIAYYVPHWHNLGDKVIYHGLKRKLTARYGEAEHVPCYMGDSPPACDVFVIAGTPWVWDLCEQSKKYEQLERTLTDMTCPVLAEGLGSCYPLEWVRNRLPILQHRSTRLVLNRIWNRCESVTVRDWLARWVLKAAGIKSKLEPCPAFLAADPTDQAGEYPLFVAYDPGKGISERCLTVDFYPRWERLSRKALALPGVKVVAICEADQAYAQRLGATEVELVREADPRSADTTALERLFALLRGATVVVSGRIHAAIPAVAMGKPTYIMPVDSRHLAATYVGAKVWGNHVSL